MKNYFPLILMLLAVCFACTFATESSNTVNDTQDTKSHTDIKYMGLTCNVVELTEIKYSYDRESQDSLGELYEKMVYKFNEHGNILEEIQYLTENIVYQKNIHTYDSGQKTTKIESYDRYEELVERMLFIYDQNGLLVGQNIYDENNKVVTNVRLKTNDKGEIINIKHYNSENKELVMEINLDYNDNGRNTLLDVNSIVSESKYKLKFSYDEKGHQKSMINSDNDGEVLENYTYKSICDKSGNWMRRYEKDNGELKYITIREIEYK